MASSEEAFARFWRWKKAHTVLKLTVLTKGGMPEKLIGAIVAIDDEALVVGFVVHKTHEFPRISFADASFGLEVRALSAERPTGDVLRFEER
jgi:hypothetical protein